jgi:putative DeoR family transcriptional regulator, stage III sporulation protein D
MDAHIKKLMLDSANKKILAVDHSKFDKISFTNIAQIVDMDIYYKNDSKEIYRKFQVLTHLSFAYNVKTSIVGGFRSLGKWYMKGYIEERAVDIANYIIDYNATVRQTAKQFGISKSTVHKDVTERLLQINPSLASRTRLVLDINKSERHIRGGMATKEKYLHQQKLNKAY